MVARSLPHAPFLNVARESLTNKIEYARFVPFIFLSKKKRKALSTVFLNLVYLVTSPENVLKISINSVIHILAAINSNISCYELVTCVVAADSVHCSFNFIVAW